MANSPLEKMAHVHRHRLQQGRRVLEDAARELKDLRRKGQESAARAGDTDALLDEAEALLAGLASPTDEQCAVLADDVRRLAAPRRPLPPLRTHHFEQLEILEEVEDADAFVRLHLDYAAQHGVDVEARLHSLLPRETLSALRRRLEEDFTYQHAACDVYDYMIAGTVGVLGGLVDIFFVGAPGEGLLGTWTDAATDKAVQGFALLCGWTPPEEGRDVTKSAIGFLERTFRVNYDQRYGADVGNAFTMSTQNHHIKSLAHSPDIVGLFFSILGQFTDTAHFVDHGRLVMVSTDAAELRGSGVAGKIFAGFVNWLGHLFSDVAGSSGAQRRGSGIPMPFFNLLQFVNAGEFGQYRQSFSTICVQVFEKGYDFRHGMAMFIPVALTEVFVRVMYMLKHHFCHHEALSRHHALTMTPELRRMLLVAHGVLCLLDAGDAALRSGGNMVAFLARTNLVGWTRFSLLAMKELKTILKCGHIDETKLDAWLESEYQCILPSY